MAVTRVNLGPLKFFASAPVPQKPRRDRGEDGGGSFFGTVIRLPFVLLASVLLAAALFLALGVALDLPGWLASGRVDPQAAHELERSFGTARWPNVMRTIGGVGLFVLSVLASIIFMLVRRRKGGIHMMRIAAGVGLILLSPFLLAGRHFQWEPMQFWPPADWGMLVDDVFNHVSGQGAILAAMAIVGGILLPLWPARSRRRREDNQTPPPSAPQSQSLPAPAGTAAPGDVK